MHRQLNLISFAFRAVSVFTIALMGQFAVSGNAQTVPSSQPAPVKLTSSELQALKFQILDTLGIRVAKPAEVPAGFQLADIQVKAASPEYGGVGYLLQYRRSNAGAAQCFGIQAATKLTSSPANSQGLAVRNPVLGGGVLKSVTTGATPTLVSSWFKGERGAAYRFVGAGAEPSLANCSNVTPEEAVSITQSLRYADSTNTQLTGENR